MIRSTPAPTKCFTTGLARLKQQDQQKEAVEVFSRLAAEHADSPLMAECNISWANRPTRRAVFVMRWPRSTA